MKLDQQQMKYVGSGVPMDEKSEAKTRANPFAGRGSKSTVENAISNINDQSKTTNVQIDRK